MNKLLLTILAAATLIFSEEAMAEQTATFAGGCFWCMQPPFDKTEGVISTTVGYTGGHKENPSYEEVSSGTTGHTEAMQVKFDETKVSYKELLEVYWKNVDPFTANAQFCDHGSQYRAGIFYHDEQQKLAAEESKARVKKIFNKEVATEISKFEKFYAGEDYHQSYYKKNPVRYKTYRYLCGRDKTLNSVWGDRDISIFGEQ